MEDWGCCPHHPHPGVLPQGTGSVVAVAAVAAVAAAVMPGRLGLGLGPGPGPGLELELELELALEPGPLLPPPLLPVLVAGDQEGCVCAYVS